MVGEICCEFQNVIGVGRERTSRPLLEGHCGERATKDIKHLRTECGMLEITARFELSQKIHPSIMKGPRGTICFPWIHAFHGLL